MYLAAENNPYMEACQSSGCDKKAPSFQSGVKLGNQSITWWETWGILESARFQPGENLEYQSKTGDMDSRKSPGGNLGISGFGSPQAKVVVLWFLRPVSSRNMDLTQVFAMLPTPPHAFTLGKTCSPDQIPPRKMISDRIGIRGDLSTGTGSQVPP